MNSKKYLQSAMRTDLKDKYEPVLERLNDKRSARLVHALLGIGGEAGELQDQLKRHLVYGKELDVVNLKEEAGDLSWYMALLLDEIGASFEEIMAMNIAKLKKRYPEGFSEEKAINRNTETEREVLETGIAWDPEKSTGDLKLIVPERLKESFLALLSVSTDFLTLDERVDKDKFGSVEKETLDFVQSLLVAYGYGHE